MIFYRPIEIERQVGAPVERIDGSFRIRVGGCEFGNGRKRRTSQFGGREEQIAVTALKTGFGFEPNSGPCETTSCPRAHRPFQPILEACRMGAAAHAFTMGIEDERGDIGQVIGRHRIRQATLKPFDGQAGGNLSNEPTRIGKARLDCNAAAFACVILKRLFGEQGVEEATAMFQRGLGLEQGRDVHLVFDAEELCKIQCSKHCCWLFAFGHQHADRCVRIDMFQYLCHSQELADSGAAFDGQRGEIGREWIDVLHQVAQRTNGALAAEIEIGPAVDT